MAKCLSSLTCLIAAAVLPLMSGCIASSAVSVVTAPVKIVGKTADLATTSRSERDENQGRDLRKRQKRFRDLQKEYRKMSERCADGNRKACRQREADYAEMQRLRRAIPQDDW